MPGNAARIPEAVRAVARAGAAGALSLALGMLILPGGNGNGPAPQPGVPAIVAGTGRHAAGVVGAGMLPAAALTADHRAALDFPRTAVAADGIPLRDSKARGPDARNARNPSGLTVMPAGTVRLPAGYLLAPLEVLVPTSPFGLRASPISGLPGDFHLGQDYAAACGTPVYAADSGLVRAAGWHPWGGGNRVEVDHGNGLITTYNHLDSSTVRAGDVVRAGQAIARVGSTGWSTGCHLHFETILNGRHVSPLSWILLPLSALAGLPPARPGGPSWDDHPGVSTAGYAPWGVPPLPGSTTTAPAPPAASPPSAAPPPNASAPLSAAPSPTAEPAPVPSSAPDLPPAEPAPAPAAPAQPEPTEPSEPAPAESPPAESPPVEPAPAEPLPPEPSPKPGVAGKGAPPSSAAREATAPSKCGQGIPSRDQYAGLPVTNHEYGQLREDAACDIPVPDTPDAE
ncbi:M23 family metallopeptidase [Pseudarthrobacter sp. NPDC058362]|uniref:M23 family metallopeptidase n=1 Tax=Pseudarthrobacter sp. NPDC058362 TaxID=3346458 RepID=UPI0036588C55